MTILGRARGKFRGWIEAHANGSRMHFSHEILRELRITNDLLRIAIVQNSPKKNPLNEFGLKVFSQADEDGITLEILRRLKLDSGVALEIGSGDGTENNSLILLAAGWRCIWIDQVEPRYLAEFDHSRLKFLKGKVSLENLESFLDLIGCEWKSQIKVLSVDVDGMEGYLTIGLLENGLRPEVLIVETNRLFPPPISYKQPYDRDYVWDHSVNCGWSLQTFVDELAKYNYMLVACSGHTGVNAFFVAAEHSHLFSDVPTDAREVFVGRGMRHIKYAHHGLLADSNTISHLIRSSHRA